MNVLITSAGTRNKIVQYFVKELKGEGKVIATDMSKYAPALYEADKFYIVSGIADPTYIDQLLNICKKEKIDCLLALIDPELSLIAENKERFIEIGVTPLISDYETVERCFNKYQMFEYLNVHGFNTPKSYINKDLFYKDLEDGVIDFPVFVKPITGSASINISKVNTKEEIETLFNKFDDLMIQEFMDGTEIGADVYIDNISKKVVSIFTKEKLKMRAGETDKGKSFKDPELFDIIVNVVESMNFSFMIDIDVFKVNGKYYISEFNPRFGGGYPHAYEAGVNFPKMIINNINGIENKNQIGDYDENVIMMKYNEVKIIRE